MKKMAEATGFNGLCVKCLRQCKQPATALLVDCPRFFPLPFKVDRHRFEQLGLFEELRD